MNIVISVFIDVKVLLSCDTLLSNTRVQGRAEPENKRTKLREVFRELTFALLLFVRFLVGE
ncbi:hypothetical protein COL32_08880 [Bacillus pseudomycoides]|nr:hypothetical protein CN584_28060 [Bacillus pseudomycoides]PFW91333.1 hypothetical protein COL29_19025 [Bacillus pseudomycoides]PFX46026.1 hypothetical protein COL32_08880 [Bacillus pseudomycoides]